MVHLVHNRWHYRTLYCGYLGKYGRLILVFPICYLYLVPPHIRWMKIDNKMSPIEFCYKNPKCVNFELKVFYIVNINTYGNVIQCTLHTAHIHEQWTSRNATQVFRCLWTNKHLFVSCVDRIATRCVCRINANSTIIAIFIGQKLHHQIS